MSSENDLDATSLHSDTNISHTLTQASSKTLDKLLRKSSSCTLSEILFSLQIKAKDISHYSIATQLRFLTQLALERFGSTYFTDFCDTICIKCFFFYRKTCLSRQIPVDFKLQPASLETNHQNPQDLMKKAYLNLDENISDEDIVKLLAENGVALNIKDACRTSPLFYTVFKSARCDLATDNACVQVFARVTDEGLRLDKRLNRPSSKRRKNNYEMIKKISLIVCKFIQFLGTMRFHLHPNCFVLTPDILSKTLEWIRGIFELQCANGDQPSLPEIPGYSLRHAVPFLFQDILLKSLKSVQGDMESNEIINKLINQVESMNTSDVTTSMEAFDNADSLIFALTNEVGDLPLLPDSEKNTCLHHAARLLFYGVPKEVVIDKVCGALKKIKADFNATNQKGETPLLFCLSSKDVATNRPSKGLNDLCKFLVENGSQWHQTTRKGESAFHLILKLCQQAILLPDESIVLEVFDILNVFSMQNVDQRKIAVNQRDIHLNTPLHLWASLAMASSYQYSSNIFADYSFEKALKRILHLLLHCEVQLDDKNDNDERPLHVCRTWAAVNLLLKVGANPDDTDSSGNTPLLAAAKNNTCLQKNSDRLYPDVSEEPKEFWKSALDKKLDLWAVDKYGKSLLSILIEKEAINLAKALVEIACEENNVNLDTIGITLLIAICQDQSPHKCWKFGLVETLLKSKSRGNLVGRPLNKKDTALHFSCRNILKLPESNVQDSVHWDIVEHLRLCGADVEAAGETGQSCLQIAETCPVLKDFLSTNVDYHYHALPPVLEKWVPDSEKHSDQLSLIARMIKCQKVGTVHFSHEPLDRESCSEGFVFVGIDAQDGRELAIKRIKNPSRQSLESNVLSTHICEQIVSYLFCREDPNFYYIAFELMEGTLEDLDLASCKEEEVNNFCKQEVLGLKFLHDQRLVHKNVNPRTVFYRIKPKLSLKIGNCVSESRRGWVPSEDLDSRSDMFSCGLVIHYILSGKKHPFAPDDVTSKTPDEIVDETERNVLHNNIVQLNDSLSPEATHLVQLMLDSSASNRPSAAEALVHPLFWTNETKKEFLHVVGNQPEVAVKRKPYPLTAFEAELEGRFSTIVTKGSEWNSLLSYDKMLETYNGMKVKSYYNYGTVAHLIRFIRNAYEHNTEQPSHIQDLWEKDFVLKEPYFPHLVIEVYKALTKSEHHELHKSRKTIKKFFNKLN